MDENKGVECEKCGWKGQIWQCKKEEFSSSPESWRSLAGKESTKYICPSCGNEIKEEVYKRS